MAARQELKTAMAETKKTPKKTTRKPAAKPAARAAVKPATRKAPAKPAAKAAAKPVKKKPAARPPADRRSKRTTAARSDAEAARDVALFDNFAVIRDLLAEHVVLTAERVQESLDDAVKRGRLLPHDAEELTQRLVTAGRRHAEELRAEFEARLKR